ncbi:tellurite resistance TerB family protein [Desulfotomaculum sp. 1211_IL3151]|uniref:tellurite resistance TerB family protein n=1 Tax=Desulfotomaculum sp. 1211_IL3151 TaxID=3084055 RepID=UPI002FDA91F8
MSFSGIKGFFNSTKSTLLDSVKRFKNKEFLDAVIAGCALVAAADGHIDSAEKTKMLGYIQRSEELKVFDTSKVIERFNHFTENFGFDHTIGKAEAYKAIMKMRSNREAARVVVSVCCAIGMADGNFDEQEKAVVRDICREIGIETSEFQL